MRGVAHASRDEAEFVRRLWDAGYRTRPRQDSTDPTTVTGYSVQPIHGDDRTWRAGGKLAKDLSLPRLRERWEAAGAEPLDNQRSVWRSPDRPAGPRRSGEPDQPASDAVEPQGDATVEREQRPVAPERWRDAVEATRNVTAGVRDGTIDPAVAAEHASGAAAALSQRLEPRSGPLAGLSAQLARQQRPRHNEPAPAVVNQLAAVALIALQGSRGGHQLTMLLLAVELARLGQAIAERNAAAHQLAEIRTLRQTIPTVETAAATAQRGGDRGWILDTPPTPLALAERHADKATAMPTVGDDLATAVARQRQRDPRRPDDRSR